MEGKKKKQEKKEDHAALLSKYDVGAFTPDRVAGNTRVSKKTEKNKSWKKNIDRIDATKDGAVVDIEHSY